MEMQAVRKRSRAVPWALTGLGILGAAFALYWYGQGRLELRGTVQSDIVVLAASTEGRVSGVAVGPGERVSRGQVLVRIDEQERRTALVRAQEQLTLLAQMLPTRYRPAPDRERDETLDQRHERSRREEDAARRRLEEASVREAEASVYYSRVAGMAAKREATEAERAQAEAHLAEIREEKARANENFEASSLSRAASGADIRRVRDAQRASGADELPEDVRLDRYRQQEERVSIAMRALEEALVRSPADGVMAGMLATPGMEASPGTPLALLRPDGAGPAVLARISADERQRLKTGMRCLVRIGDEAERDGYIADLRPEAEGDAPDFRALVALLPQEPAAHGTAGGARSSATDAAGLEAVVTVLLREPLYAALSEGGGEGVATSVTRSGSPAPPAHPAAPSGAPLAVQTPFGADGVPEAAAVNPEGGVNGTAAPGRGAPLLPPMQAPYPLKGSPLPDPSNNPSVVRGEILDNAATTPR